MKLNQKLKLTLVILIVILLSIIGFAGIYVQNKNIMNNILPDYLLSMDLKGYRRIELKMSSDSTTVKYDAEGKEIDENDKETQVASTQEKKTNEDSVKTEENYKKVKEIIKTRLEKLNVEEFNIRQAKDSENIIVEIPENENTDTVVSQLQLQGKFEIVDKDTNEVLMTNDDVEKVEAGYGSTSSGTVVFLNIKFNKEGKEKFKNITNTYVENSANTENQNTEETETTTQEKSAKEITIKIDDSELLSTHFDEEISNGILQLSVGSSTNSSTDELKEYYEQANRLAAILDAGKMPIVYETEQNKYVKTDIMNNQISVAISVCIVVATILMIVIIIQNKEKGILSAISFVGYIALLLIAIRYTNVTVSIEGIAAIIAIAILQYAFLFKISNVKQEEYWNTYLKYVWVLIPLAVIAVTFALTTTCLPISSFGMVTFWGLIVFLVWNAVITKNIIEIKK